MSPYRLPSPEIPGWMRPPELAWLYREATQVMSVVEVGSWLGRSVHALCSGCRGTVTAVDHWRGSPDPRDATHRQVKRLDAFAVFLANVGHFPNLQVLREASVDAARRFPDASVDMVFLDGGHDYVSVAADLSAWSGKARRLLCGHDRRLAGVSQALAEWGRQVYKAPGTIWYVRL